MHWYVACRLVIEGGFDPDEITPRPPFVIEHQRPDRGRRLAALRHEPTRGGEGERTILGGLKTKAVDVVVAKPGIGPVLAVSLKGTLGAFRNLTNRMEEAVGDCTNLHISYPVLVYGFLQVLRATREAPGLASNDVALDAKGCVVDSIIRYHDVISRLAGREDLRNDATKYEAVGLILAGADKSKEGTILPDFPAQSSPLHVSGFFDKLYAAYDRRFVYAAPNLERDTVRMEWDVESPALSDARAREIAPRTAGE